MELQSLSTPFLEEVGMTPSPVQIEVNVQDYFFEADDSADPSIAESRSVVEPESYSQTEHLQTGHSQSAPQESPIAIATWQHWFQRWMNQLDPSFSTTKEYELSLRLTNDAEIQTFNAQYRQMDQPTDVLAFAALETEYPELDELAATPLYLGDIVISVETAQQQAIAQQHSLTQELAWLAAHGLLHLLGWDHPDDDRLRQMLHQQEVLLQTIGLEI